MLSPLINVECYSYFSKSRNNHLLCGMGAYCYVNLCIEYNNTANIERILASAFSLKKKTFHDIFNLSYDYSIKIILLYFVILQHRLHIDYIKPHIINDAPLKFISDSSIPRGSLSSVYRR